MACLQHQKQTNLPANTFITLATNTIFSTDAIDIFKKTLSDPDYFRTVRLTRLRFYRLFTQLPLTTIFELLKNEPLSPLFTSLTKNVAKEIAPAFLLLGHEKATQLAELFLTDDVKHSHDQEFGGWLLAELFPSPAERLQKYWEIFSSNLPVIRQYFIKEQIENLLNNLLEDEAIVDWSEEPQKTVFQTVIAGLAARGQNKGLVEEVPVKQNLPAPALLAGETLLRRDFAPRKVAAKEILAAALTGGQDQRSQKLARSLLLDSDLGKVSIEKKRIARNFLLRRRKNSKLTITK